MNTQLEFIKTKDGAEIAQGYGVIFTDANNLDLDGEYFDAKTNFFIDKGESKSVPLMFDHGMDKHTKREFFGTVTYTRDDKGIYAKADLTIKSPELFTKEVLKRRELYIAEMRKLATEGKLAWSSGAVGHAVIKEDGYIKQWPIGEFSFTPTPAESNEQVEINVFKHIVTSEPMKKETTDLSTETDSVKELLTEIVGIKSLHADLKEIKTALIEVQTLLADVKSEEVITIDDDKPEIQEEISLSDYINEDK